jgi:hypothetical protein
MFLLLWESLQVKTGLVKHSPPDKIDKECKFWSLVYVMWLDAETHLHVAHDMM